MSQWAREGLSPDLFWTQTPRTFAAIMKGRQDARQDRHDEAVAMAWHTAALNRADPKKPLPALAKLLKRKTAPKEQQTPDDMLAVFRAYHAAGAPMTIRRIG